MLVSTITFEIRNFNDGSFSEYLIANTPENQEKVFSHRFTRCIKFTETFSFQFEREMSMPIEFIEMGTWATMIAYCPQLPDYIDYLETVEFLTPVAELASI